LNTDYEIIKHSITEIHNPTPKDLRNIVIEIRKNKLPDVSELPSAGSFFKNPIISISLFNKIRVKYPNIVSFPIDDENIKISAGWLIEQLGFKGKRHGKVGVHEKQALIIVNYDNASSEEIIKLSEEIKHSIYSVFQIKLEEEVIFI